MAAVDHNGLIDVKLTTGTVNADTFYDLIRDLLPNLQPFDGTNELPSWIIVLFTTLTVLHHCLKQQEY